MIMKQRWLISLGNASLVIYRLINFKIVVILWTNNFALLKKEFFHSITFRPTTKRVFCLFIKISLLYYRSDKIFKTVFCGLGNFTRNFSIIWGTFKYLETLWIFFQNEQYHNLNTMFQSIQDSMFSYDQKKFF